MKTLLLVDGNALLYRAYHAFPKELSTPTGEKIGAVYGFTRILLSTIRSLKPDSVAVCFDLKGPTFRHEKYEGYKATRQKMPDELAGQIERMYQIVGQLEFPIYTSEGYEADDIIGTLAHQAVETDPEVRVVILTADQDLLQLVSDRIYVYSPSAQTSIMYTPDRVWEKYSFRPIQMIEYKALRGDPSDNLPGVPGIGEVTATKLIQEFGTIEKLYEAVESGKTESIKPAVLEKLKGHKESALMSHELATIHIDAPVTLNLNDCRLELKHPEQMVTLFQELGFKSLMRDLPVSHRLLSEASDIFTDSDQPADSPPPPPTEETESDRLDQAVAPVLRAMEERGAKVDRPYLEQLEQEYNTELADIRARLIDLAGEEFNPDSPQQVSHILYEVLQIPTKMVRKGKNGYTTDAATLQSLAKQYPIAQLLLNYRELQKLQTTYVRPLQQLADSHDRIHTSYAPDTAPGRISSRNPNLQNIPIRTEQGRRLRRAFIADTDHTLVAADYSQVQLRVAADLSDDPAMKEVFQSGRDFHTETATKMGIDRHLAKVINFSILFGKGPYGFSQDIGCTVAEAREYIEQYFATYSKLHEYLEGILTTARRDGCLVTAQGRRREFPDITSSNFQHRSAAEREALSFTIQAAEAFIMKTAMVELDSRLVTQPVGKLILTVHDELVMEVPIGQEQEAGKLLREVMVGAGHLSVPLEVHTKTGPNWAEMEPLELAE